MNFLSVRFVVAMLISLINGILIWWWSPAITGQKEPWDGNAIFYYIACLFISGLISGFIVGSRYRNRLGFLAAFTISGEAIFQIWNDGFSPLMIVGLFF